MRILIVEDDRFIGDALQVGLKQRGYVADWVQEGKLALEALSLEPYAALVLDLGLPDQDGLSVLNQIRLWANPLPVLVLTARDTISDKITGLDAGADDYLIKPFDLDEVAARLRALIRRAKGVLPSECLVVGELSLNQATRVVRFKGEEKNLSAKEGALLELFMLNAGRVLTKHQLESHLYAWGEEICSNVIEVHLHHLRKKLSPEIIRSLRGIGWMMPKETP